MNPVFRRRLGVGVRLLLGGIALVFLVVAFRSNWDRSRQQVLPSAWAFAEAFVLVLVGLVLGARGWASLLSGEASGAALAGGFYTAQLGKYVPGGVWQAVGQVGLARRAGVGTSSAVTAFPVHAIAQATAGGTVGAGLIVAGQSVPLAIRLASLSGLLLLPLLRRAWMVRVVGLLARVLKRSWPGSLVPTQSRILRSYCYAVGSILSNGVAFTLLALSVHAVPSAIAGVAGYALAWTAGFLAVPFPSGVGIREAVLIAIFGPFGGTAPIIGASVAHRLVAIVAELLMTVWASTLGARRIAVGSGTPRAGPT
jgi:glycosyltransferase 2 family protein